MKKRCTQFIAALISVALVWTSSQTAQAAGLLMSHTPTLGLLPRVVQPLSSPSYFTQQAIVQHLITPLNAPWETSEGYLINSQLGARPTVAFHPLVENPSLTLLWTFRLGQYGFQLLNEYSHLIVALLWSPAEALLQWDASFLKKTWGAVFSKTNLLGNQPWSSYWVKGVLTGSPQQSQDGLSQPQVVVPVPGRLGHFLYQKGGFVISFLMLYFAVTYGFPHLSPLVSPFAALFAAGAFIALPGAFMTDVLQKGIAGVYQCGNLFMILIEAMFRGELGLDTVVKLEVPITIGEDVLSPDFIAQEPQVIEITVRQLLMDMLTMLDVRGRLQAGIVAYFKNGTQTSKINTPKRSPLPKELIAVFERDGKGHNYVFENGVLRISAHVRAPTSPGASGKLETAAAQPHQYQVDRKERVGDFVQLSDGHMDFVESETERVIVVKQGHNGDGERLTMHGWVLDASSKMYDLMDKIFGIFGTKKVGDSKVISGLADLFFTQGRAAASARLAYHTRIPHGHTASEEVRFPPQELFKDIGQFVLNGIQQQVRLNRLHGQPGMRLSQVPEEQRMELKARLLQVLVGSHDDLRTANKTLPKDQQLSETLIHQIQSERLPGRVLTVEPSNDATVRALRARPLWQRMALIDKTVDAYFGNNLYNGFREATHYVEGTFGIVLETTEGSADNQETVVFTRGQMMSAAWDSAMNIVFGASSRQALNKFRYRYDLAIDGQILGISYRVNPDTGKRQFDMHSHLEKGDRELTHDEILSHVIDRHLNRYMEKIPDINTDDRMAAEMAGIPDAHRKFLESIDNPNSSNFHTLQTIVAVLEEIATGKRKAKIAILGSEKSMDAGKSLARGLRATTSADQLSAGYVPPNYVLRAIAAGWTKNLRKKLGISEKTFVVGISASGGDTFDTGRACEVLTGFVDEMVIFAGLWDIDLAAAVGQGLNKEDLPSGRIMNTFGGWSLAEPATRTDSAMEFALTQSWLRALQIVKRKYPDSPYLAIDLEDEDFELLKNQITTEYLNHEARILGIKSNAQGPVLDNAGNPQPIETPEHIQLEQQARLIAQRTLENIYVNFMAMPALYAVAVRFGWHLFPSTWSFFPQGQNFVEWIASSGQFLPRIAVPSEFQGLVQIVTQGLNIAGVTADWIWNYPILMVANVGFVILLPWAVMIGWRFIYRVAHGQGSFKDRAKEARRNLFQRRGSVITLIVDHARTKIRNLYAKSQAGMFGENEPPFKGATDNTVIHDYSFEIRRGTLIIHSRASGVGIDTTDHEATSMVESQSKLVQHVGTGPEIISFDHLAYKTPIRAPYERFVEKTAKELNLDPSQILELNRFLVELPEVISTFKSMHRGALLEDLPEALGGMLGLEDDRLVQFAKAVEHYIDRQLALEEYFKTHFGNAENWTKHYVFAHTWAKENAHPWFLRAAVYIIDHIPGHEWMLQKFPLFHLYIDVSRTFVGTGRVTTASPYPASIISSVRAKYPSILTKRYAAPLPIVQSRPGKTVSLTKSTKKDTSGVVDDFLKGLRQPGQAVEYGPRRTPRTSLIETGKPKPIEKESVVVVIPLNNRGRMSERPEGMSDVLFRGISNILNTLSIGAITNRPLYLIVQKDAERMSGLVEANGSLFFRIDEQVVKDAAQNNIGALRNGMLQMGQEVDHLQALLDGTEDTMSEEELDVELITQEMAKFALLDEEERIATMEYLKSHDNPYDDDYAHRLYAPVHGYVTSRWHGNIPRDDSAVLHKAFEDVKKMARPTVTAFVSEKYESRKKAGSSTGTAHSMQSTPQRIEATRSGYRVRFQTLIGIMLGLLLFFTNGSSSHTDANQVIRDSIRTKTPVSDRDASPSYQSFPKGGHGPTVVRAIPSTKSTTQEKPSILARSMRWTIQNIPSWLRQNVQRPVPTNRVPDVQTAARQAPQAPVPQAPPSTFIEREVVTPVPSVTAPRDTSAKRYKGSRRAQKSETTSQKRDNKPVPVAVASAKQDVSTTLSKKREKVASTASSSTSNTGKKGMDKQKLATLLDDIRQESNVHPDDATLKQLQTVIMQAYLHPEDESQRKTLQQWAARLKKEPRLATIMSALNQVTRYSGVPSSSLNLIEQVLDNGKILAPIIGGVTAAGAQVLSHITASITQLPLAHAINSPSLQVAVLPGDGWWRLAERWLGSGARWKEMADANPNVTSLSPWQNVTLPGHQIVSTAWDQFLTHAQSSLPAVEPLSVTQQFLLHPSPLVVFGGLVLLAIGVALVVLLRRTRTSAPSTERSISLAPFSYRRAYALVLAAVSFVSYLRPSFAATPIEPTSPVVTMADPSLLPTLQKESAATHALESTAEKSAADVKNFSTHFKAGAFFQGEVGSLASNGRLISYGPYLDILLHWNGSPADKQSARDDARNTLLENNAHMADDRTQMLAVVDAMLEQQQHLNEADALTHDLLPVAQTLQKNVQAHQSTMTDPAALDVVGQVERRLQDIQANADLAAARAKRRAKLPLDETSASGSATPLDVQSLVSQLTADPALEQSLLALLTAVQKSQTAVEMDPSYRSAWRRFLPSDLTLRLNPNLRNPLSFVATRYFLIGLVNPAWTRSKKADFEAETKALQAAQSTVQSDIETTFRRVYLLLSLMQSQQAEFVQQSHAYNEAVDSALKESRSVEQRANDVAAARDALTKREAARRQVLMTQVLFLGLGASVDEVNTALTASSEQRAEMAAQRVQSSLNDLWTARFAKPLQGFDAELKAKTKKGKSKQAQLRAAYMKAEAAILEAVRTPLDAEALAASTVAALQETAETDAFTVPAATEDALKEEDASSISGFQAVRADPYLAYLRALHRDAPIPSTPDADTIDQRWTGSESMAFTLTFNAGSMRELQKNYKAAVATTQSAIDAEKANVHSWNLAKATLSAQSINAQLAQLTQERQALNASTLVSTEERRQRLLAIDGDVAHLQTELLTLEQKWGALKPGIRPIDFPDGFVPLALLQRDLQQQLLVDALGRLKDKQLRQLPLAAGSQASRNFIFGWLEPDLTGLIFKPVVSWVGKLFSRGSKPAEPNLLQIAEDLTAESHIVNTKTSFTQATAYRTLTADRLKTAQDQVSLAQQLVDQATSPEAAWAAVQDLNAARRVAWQATAEHDQAVLYFTVMSTRYELYQTLFEKDMDSDEFKTWIAFFGIKPTSDDYEKFVAAVIAFREKFKTVWTGEAKGPSLDDRAKALKIALAKKGITDPSLFSGFAGGPFAAGTFEPAYAAPGSAPTITTTGTRFNFNVNLAPKKSKKQQAAAEAKINTDSADQAALQKAAQQVAAAKVSGLLVAARDVDDFRKTLEKTVVGLEDSFDILYARKMATDVLLAGSAYQVQAANASAMAGIDTPDITAVSLDSTRTVPHIADPVAYAHLVAKGPIVETPDHPSQTVLQLAVSGFAQKGIQEGNIIGQSAGGRVIVGPVLDPRIGRAQKKADAAQVALDERKADLAFREAVRLATEAALELNRAGNVYEATTARTRLARANFERIAAAVQSGNLNIEDLALATSELTDALGSQAVAYGDWQSAYAQVLVFGGVDPSSAPPAEKIAALGIDLRPIHPNQKVELASLAAMAPNEERDALKAMAKQIIGGGRVDQKVIDPLKTFMQNQQIPRSHWGKLVAFAQDADLLKPASGSTADKLKAFIGTITLFSNFYSQYLYEQHQAKMASQEALKIFLVDRAYENTIPAIVREVHDLRPLGEEWVAKKWFANIEAFDQWLFEGAAIFTTTEAYVDRAKAIINDPVVLKAGQELAALIREPEFKVLVTISKEFARPGRPTSSEDRAGMLKIAAVLVARIKATQPDLPAGEELSLISTAMNDAQKVMDGATIKRKKISWTWPVLANKVAAIAETHAIPSTASSWQTNMGAMAGYFAKEVLRQSLSATVTPRRRSAVLVAA